MHEHAVDQATGQRKRTGGSVSTPPLELVERLRVRSPVKHLRGRGGSDRDLPQATSLFFPERSPKYVVGVHDSAPRVLKPSGLELGREHERECHVVEGAVGMLFLSDPDLLLTVGQSGVKWE